MKHWSRVEYLSQTVKNPYIIIKGTHSYYSDAWSGSFEESCVRYLYGDEISLKSWQPQWDIDKLYIGDYVCIGAESVILMGGNNTHRQDWFSSYPFMEHLVESYIGKGDTHIHDGVWIGMRAIIMPGVEIGEGAVIGAGSVVTKNIPPYAIVAGNPAKIVKMRFETSVVERLLKLKLYELPETVFNLLHNQLCNSNIDALEQKIIELDIT